MATAEVIKINDFTIAYEDGLIKFERDGDAIPRCIRDTDLGVLVELLDMLQQDRRRSRRIPVRGHATLEAFLRVNQIEERVLCHDLSVAGILVEVAHRNQPFKKGQHVQISLVVGALRAVVDGVIARQDGNKYGIDFVWDDSECPLLEMDHLRDICNLVELDWIRTRLYGLKKPQ